MDEIAAEILATPGIEGVTERLCLRSVSLGASDDLQRASHTARLMSLVLARDGMVWSELAELRTRIVTRLVG